MDMNPMERDSNLRFLRRPSQQVEEVEAFASESLVRNNACALFVKTRIPSNCTNAWSALRRQYEEASGFPSGLLDWCEKRGVGSSPCKDLVLTARGVEALNARLADAVHRLRKQYADRVQLVQAVFADKCGSVPRADVLLHAIGRCAISPWRVGAALAPKRTSKG